MSKKIIMTFGILILGIISFILLKNPFTLDTHVANKEKQESLFTIEESIVNKVIEKLQQKYVGVDVKTTSNKEVLLQVVADEEYFNSVKNDMESIVRSVIKDSILKDYMVVFERWDLIGDAEEIYNKEMLILQTLMKGLKDYKVINNISTDSQQSFITIHTSIKGSDKDSNKLLIEIEEAGNKILNSKELNSVSNIDSYEIKILNIKGEVVN